VAADVAPADPERFPEASKWFREKVAVTRDEWSTMTYEARAQSFTIAGAQQLDAVQTVMDSLQSAIDKGTPIDEWRKNVRESLGKKFGKLNASHLDTAFINAHQSAYNAGRWEQLSDSSVTAALPYRKFDAVLDSRVSDRCKACAGTILPHDDPWWLTHWPPLHHRCRSTVRALSARMAKRAGGVTNKPSVAASGDFGLAPGAKAGAWEPDLSKYESHAAREYTKKQRSMRAREAKKRSKSA
jgi:phage putative head morphogenesis protein, SPP1 gp7 family